MCAVSMCACVLLARVLLLLERKSEDFSFQLHEYACYSHSLDHIDEGADVLVQ